MCQYYKKRHTCNCLGRTQLERCRAALLSNAICTDIPPISEDGETPTDPSQIRSSVFPCFDCIRAEALREIVESAERPGKGKAMSPEQMQRLAYKREKSETVRKAAAERAARERQAEELRMVKQMAEKEREKREGRMWIDVESARKSRGRHHNHRRAGIPHFTTDEVQTPKTAPPDFGVFPGRNGGGGRLPGRGGGGGGILGGAITSEGSASSGKLNKMGEFGQKECSPKIHLDTRMQAEPFPPVPRGGVSGSWRGGAPKIILKNTERKEGEAASANKNRGGGGSGGHRGDGTRPKTGKENLSNKAASNNSTWKPNDVWGSDK